MNSKITQVTVRRDGLDVVLVVNGQRIIDIPWDAALMLARAMTVQAHNIEEQVKAPAIAFDQGLLMRKGIPIGLTSDPRILHEAGNEAAWNPLLRKALPGGIRTLEAVGAPSVTKHRRQNNGLRKNER